VARVRFGTGVASTFTAHYDDVSVSASAGDYPLREGRILGYGPDGAGTHATPASFQNNDGTAVDATTPGRLDERPLTSTADYAKQVTAGAGAFLELTLENTGEASAPAGVSALVAYHAAGTTANNGETRVVRQDGTPSSVYAGDMSETSCSSAAGSSPRPRPAGRSPSSTP
jgi:hypothetical protein